MVTALADLRDATVPLALTGAGIVVAGFVLGPAAARAVRRRPALLLGAALLCLSPVFLLAFAWFASDVYYAGDVLDGLGAVLTQLVWLLPPLLVVVAAAGGLVLLADDLRARLGGAQAARTPWQRMTGATGATAGATTAPAPRPWRALAGLALIALAALLALAFAQLFIGVGLAELLLVLAAGGAVLAVIGAPLAIASLVRAERGRVRAAREDERQRMAAHLHDSVLQTLALVQRVAHDRAAVARLVRRQEHELRAWMAGEVELGAETLASALRDAVAAVEDEQDTTIDVTLLGDRALDPIGEALAAAAREALRNAARHAPGAPIFVFAQLGPDGAEVFVRGGRPAPRRTG